MDIREEIWAGFADSIDSGLLKAKDRMLSEGERYNNSVNFQKIDDIFNACYSGFIGMDDVEVIPLRLGGFELPLIFDCTTGMLFNVMNEKRFSKILAEFAKGKHHYFEALANYNDGPDFDRMQQVISEEIFLPDSSKVDSIKHEIQMKLHGREPAAYITIAFSMNGFNLIGLKAITTSQYLEVISEIDLSHHIKADYTEPAATTNIETDYYDMDITLKEDILSSSSDLDDSDVSMSDEKDIQDEEN